MNECEQTTNGHNAAMPADPPAVYRIPRDGEWFLLRGTGRVLQAGEGTGSAHWVLTGELAEIVADQARRLREMRAALWELRGKIDGFLEE